MENAVILGRTGSAAPLDIFTFFVKSRKSVNLISEFFLVDRPDVYLRDERLNDLCDERKSSNCEKRAD